MKQPLPIHSQPQRRLFMLRFKKRRKPDGIGVVAVLRIKSGPDADMPPSSACRGQRFFEVNP